MIVWYTIKINKKYRKIICSKVAILKMYNFLNDFHLKNLVVKKCEKDFVKLPNYVVCDHSIRYHWIHLNVINV